MPSEAGGRARRAPARRTASEGVLKLPQWHLRDAMKIKPSSQQPPASIYRNQNAVLRTLFERASDHRSDLAMSGGAPITTDAAAEYPRLRQRRGAQRSLTKDSRSAHWRPRKLRVGQPAWFGYRVDCEVGRRFVPRLEVSYIGEATHARRGKCRHNSQEKLETGGESDTLGKWNLTQRRRDAEEGKLRKTGRTSSG